MKHIFKWVDKNKNKDNTLVLLLRLIYSITTDIVNVIINVVAPIYISVLFEKTNKKGFIIVLISYVLIEIFYSIKNAYINRQNKEIKNSKMILDEIDIINTSFDNYINNEDDNNGIFEFASDLVSASLYNVLTKITDSEIRVSVIQQFKDNKNKYYSTMISRYSRKRQKCQKSQKVVKYDKNKDYYYQKILKDNDENIIVLNKEKIDKYFVYKSSLKSNIRQYFCRADKYQSDDVVFLLQIDSMKDDAFGEDNEEIRLFYENYIYPYICFLRHAYNIERNLKKEGGINE